MRLAALSLRSNWQLPSQKQTLFEATAMPVVLQAAQQLGLEGCFATLLPSCVCCIGLVETSNNLAAVKLSSSSSSTDSAAAYTITCSTRSSLAHAMEVQRARIADIARLCGATVAQDKAYPGWAPNPNSPVLEVSALAQGSAWSLDWCARDL